MISYCDDFDNIAKAEPHQQGKSSNQVPIGLSNLLSFKNGILHNGQNLSTQLDFGASIIGSENFDVVLKSFIIWKPECDGSNK